MDYPNRLVQNYIFWVFFLSVSVKRRSSHCFYVTRTIVRLIYWPDYRQEIWRYLVFYRKANSNSLKFVTCVWESGTDRPGGPKGWYWMLFINSAISWNQLQWSLKLNIFWAQASLENISVPEGTLSLPNCCEFLCTLRAGEIWNHTFKIHPKWAKIVHLNHIDLHYSKKKVSVLFMLLSCGKVAGTSSHKWCQIVSR